MTFKSHPTLVDVLLERRSSDRGVNFVLGQGNQQRVPYPVLLTRALQRLAQFQSQGLNPGSQLIIQTSDNAAFLEGFWACLLGGITAVPVSGGNSAEHRFKLFRIADKLEAPGLFTDAATQQRLESFAIAEGLDATLAQLTQRSVASDVAAPDSEPGTVYPATPDDTAFIQFSSGSTSTPKGVVLTHKNLMCNHLSIIDGCAMTAEDHLFSWMPLTHDMGLIGFHLTPVVRDVEHSLMPTDVFVRRPGLWLTAAADLKATMLCSPNFGYQHVLKSFKPDKYTEVNLSGVRLVFNGAEPISVALCERFMQAMAPLKLKPEAMFPVYGLAEASLAVTFPDLNDKFNTLCIARKALGVGEQIQTVDDEHSTQAVSFVSVGQAVPNVSVQIRDADGSPLADNITGHICIRGDNVTGGYYQEPELNARTIDADGWLDTGDLGFLRQGQLYITGRAKDIIFVSGQNVYPHDLEEIVLQQGLVERGKLAISSYRDADAAEEQLVVFVLHRTDSAELLEPARAITRLLGEAAGVRVHAVVPVNRIPKTTSGKVQRYLLIESLMQGEFSALVQSPETADSADEPQNTTHSASDDVDPAGQSTAEQLLAICQSHVEDVPVTPTDNLFDLGISSLTLAQIHAAIEERWPDQVDITDLFDYPTVSELAVFLDERNAA